jgi:hypothetical protein
MKNDQKKGGSDRKHQGHRRNDRPRPEFVEMELWFVEQRYGDGSSTPVCILQDGTRIYPRSPRFNPQTSTEQEVMNGTPKVYTCNVRFFPGKSKADCMPKKGLEYQLTPEEWMPEAEWRRAIVVPLTFEKDSRDPHGRPKAFHKGKVVFVDRGSECSLNETRQYLLSFGANVAYAHALPKSEGSGSGFGTMALVLGEKLGEMSLEGLRHVPFKQAFLKSGVVVPKTEKDLVIKSSYKKVEEMLGINLDPAKGDLPTEGEINRILKLKRKVLHPDVALVRLGKAKTVKDEKNVEFFWTATNQAAEQALQYLKQLAERKASKPARVEAPVSAPQSIEEALRTAVEAPKAEIVTKPTPAETVKVEAVAEEVAELPAEPATVPAAPVPAKAEITEEEIIAKAAEIAGFSVEELLAKKAEAPGYFRHFYNKARQQLAAKSPAVEAPKAVKKDRKVRTTGKGLEALKDLAVGKGE